MYVCICKAVTESQICDAIRQGLSTRKEISACLKAGTACGKCNPEVNNLLHRSCAANHASAVTKTSETRHHIVTSHPTSTPRIRRGTHGSACAGSGGLRISSAGT